MTGPPRPKKWRNKTRIVIFMAGKYWVDVITTSTMANIEAGGRYTKESSAALS